MDAAVWIVFCLLASFGVVQAVGWLLCLFTRPKSCNRGYYVLSLPTDAAELETQLRHGLLCVQWGGGFQQAYIVLLDHGLDPEGQKICQKMIKDVHGVFVCTPDEFAEAVRIIDNLQIEEQKI